MWNQISVCLIKKRICVFLQSWNRFEFLYIDGSGLTCWAWLISWLTCIREKSWYSFCRSKLSMPPSHAATQWGLFIAPLVWVHVSRDDQAFIFLATTAFHALPSDLPPSIHQSPLVFATTSFHVSLPDSQLFIYQAVFCYESPDIQALPFSGNVMEVWWSSIPKP